MLSKATQAQRSRSWTAKGPTWCPHRLQTPTVGTALWNLLKCTDHRRPDPLNLPPWRKWTILILVAAYSCTAVVLATGMGPIFSMITAYYPGQELRATDLMTYPTLFMGLGNLMTMPMALTIGRRPIFLASMLIMMAGGVWCACSQSLGSHIAGRAVMSLAAGQSEALSPMIVQGEFRCRVCWEPGTKAFAEIYFLHERGRKVAWFIFIQNCW